MLAAPGNRLFLSDEVLTSPCLLLALTAAKADETLQGVQGSSSSLKVQGQGQGQVQGQGSSFKGEDSRLKVTKKNPPVRRRRWSS